MKVSLPLILLALQVSLFADVRLPQLFSDNAILQREVPFKIWGWADPNEKITIDFVGIKYDIQANASGNWEVGVPAQKAGGPHKLIVQGKNTVERSNILFGEVWLCSGQSNMQWGVGQSGNGDLEFLLAKNTNIRMISVNNWGSQEPQHDVDGKWEIASGQDLRAFSAVGYYFGRELNRALNVPIGLINNAWGGSACEAWVPKDVLLSDLRNQDYIEKTEKLVAECEANPEYANFVKLQEEWQKGLITSVKTLGPKPRAPKKPAKSYHSQHRPANLWNARIYPLLKYKIKGAIWYQGEANASRAYNYRYLLPMMIESWRKEWQLGDFPFTGHNWPTLAKNRDKNGNSPWAEIRESMTIAFQNTKNTGQTIITDLGEDRL